MRLPTSSLFLDECRGLANVDRHDQSGVWNIECSARELREGNSRARPPVRVLNHDSLGAATMPKGKLPCLQRSRHARIIVGKRIPYCWRADFVRFALIPNRAREYRTELAVRSFRHKFDDAMRYSRRVSGQRRRTRSRPGSFRFVRVRPPFLQRLVIFGAHARTLIVPNPGTIHGGSQIFGSEQVFHWGPGFSLRAAV